MFLKHVDFEITIAFQVELTLILSNKMPANNFNFVFQPIFTKLTAHLVLIKALISSLITFYVGLCRIPRNKMITYL